MGRNQAVKPVFRNFVVMSGSKFSYIVACVHRNTAVAVFQTNGRVAKSINAQFVVGKVILGGKVI